MIEISEADLRNASPEELEVLLAALEAAEANLAEWRLQPRQQRAEDFTKQADRTKAFELLYGGSAGGGKTDWLLWHCYMICKRYPGARCLYLRRTFPELQRSAISRSQERFDRNDAKWNETKKEWRFKNGSVLEFGYLEQPTDQYNFQSAEYVCVAWDELTQWPTDGPYRYLMSRLRAPYALTKRGLVPHVVAATNPGNVGGGWVRKRWIDLGPAETIHDVADPETGKWCRRVFVPARLSDNAYIDQEAYEANLSFLDTATRKALLDGSWDVVEGQYFGEFDRAVHVVEPFAIPEWWTRVRGYDFGFANPAAMLWGAFDGDGNCWIYREFYKAGLTVPAQADEIKRLSVMRDEQGRDRPEPIDYSVADPSIWTRTGAGAPIAQQFVDQGVVFRRALNARIDGWLRVREFLAVNKVTGEPRMRIFDTCTELIRTLPMMVRDVRNPEDLNSDGEDHLVDSCRYLLMSRPRGARPPRPDDLTLEGRIAEKHRRKEAAYRGGMVDHPVTGWT